jgi:hypothetical protein
MKATLVAILILSVSPLFGQSKWELVGEYQHTSFMYSYILSLKDSENYEIVETTCLGRETTLGTWRIQGQAIRLSPKKKITVIHPDKTQLEQIITNHTEKIVIIESINLLSSEYADGISLKRITK